MASGFFLISDTLTPLLLHLDAAEETEQTLREYAGEVQAYAQQNAPWEDRTGDARQGLGVDVRKEGTDVVLELSHGVDYGLYLEVKNNGELAIIMPTLEHFAAEIFLTTGSTPSGETLL